MKRTYRKNILRTIKSSFSRFLAIFAIVALGVGFLAGLLSSPVDMRLSVETYFDDSDMYDLRVVSTLGLTDDDLRSVKSIEGVEDVLPVKDADLVFTSDEGDALTTRVHTLPEDSSQTMNGVELISGRMPEKAGECIVIKTQSMLTEDKDWEGETLTLDKGTDYDEDDYDGVPESLTVVGTATSAMYISMEQEYTNVGTGAVSLIVYTVAESFDYDYYTGFYITMSGAGDLDSFGSEYEEIRDEIVSTLEALGEERSDIRFESIVNDANEELNDAKKEYEDGKAEAEEKLDEAEQELLDAEQEIEDSEQQLNDAKQQIEDGKAELEQSKQDYEEQIAESEQQISDGYYQIQQYQNEIASGRTQIAEAQKQIDEGLEELTAGDEQLSAAKAELDEQRASLEALEAGKEAFWQAVSAYGLPSEDTSDSATLAAMEQLSVLSPENAEQFSELKAGLEALAEQGTDTDTAKAALEAGEAEYEENLAAAEEARAKLKASQAEIDSKTAQLDESEASLNSQLYALYEAEDELEAAKESAQTQFAEAEQELADAQAEYDDGVIKLEEGKQELEDGKQEYEDSKADVEKELSEAEEKIADAEEEISEIEEGEWYVYTRDDNVGYSSYDSNADKIAAIASVFPVFFFLVAALVSLTTMTRMVEEERQQIGTMKALGYSNLSIALKYLIYAAMASVCGSIFGLAIGLRLFPYIIISAYNIMYSIPEALTPFNLSYSLFASVAMLVCTMLATISACAAALKESPASLMLPKAPKAGKRVFLEKITPIWSRMKFTHKVTARNLLRYKKRFLMTVIGISGCTALLVTGFGVKDSVSDIVELQYNDLNKYQLMVVLSDERALESDKLNTILNDESLIGSSTAVLQDSGTIVPNGDDPEDSVTIFVPQDVDSLTDYLTFRHRTDSTPVEYNENSVIITEKLSERQHLSVGDTITVKNQDEKEASFVITDICENYVSHYLYISPAAYKEAFGDEPEMNVLLCKLPLDEAGEISVDEDELSMELLKCDDVAATRFTDELSSSFANSIESINSIILVIIISAGALAFVVLYNLTNINISERIKEIATIKVLGFYDNEVSAYIYRENAVLTIIGDAVGLVLGVFLHQFIIRTAEIDVVMFGRSVYPLSFVWSALLTLVFSILVNLVMHRKLKNVSMVESMKAPE